MPATEASHQPGQPGRDRRGRPGGHGRQHEGEQAAHRARRPVRPDRPGEQDTERDGQRHERGEKGGGRDQGTDHHQGRPGERQAQMGDRLVPPRAAEAGHHQGGEPAESGEGGHLAAADDLIGESKQGRDDQGRSHRPQPGIRRPGPGPGSTGPGPERTGTWPAAKAARTPAPGPGRPRRLLAARSGLRAHGGGCRHLDRRFLRPAGTSWPPGVTPNSVGSFPG